MNNCSPEKATQQQKEERKVFTSREEQLKTHMEKKMNINLGLIAYIIIIPRRITDMNVRA